MWRLVRIGLTAPVCVLREGIEDGYLTAFCVRPCASTRDVYEFDGADQVSAGELEEWGRSVSLS
ncbi:hypothetical protein [Thalassobium sp. R2A62]|uniref:hypothetical protein n=1 Tax=Thalassobium sp. R2A62 TaxID=633131 RepID=UPI0001B1D846|nr:hypothetical protein [Thalassobium sp. R2A62]EET48820.1 type I restriction enzyme subunit, putative [Thalassobium sp. R2A62]MDG1339429.1 hypothetical protein [Paracoccaceae bacterium]